LKGWPAIAAIFAIIVGLAAYQFYLYDDLENNPEIREDIARNLTYELAGDMLADTSDIREAIKAGDKKEAEAIAKGLLERKITIHDLAMKGRGENIVIKADYTIHGPEGDEEKTGYFEFSHSPLTGWRYHRETWAFSWYFMFI
jgi:hypothetical protein